MDNKKTVIKRGYYIPEDLAKAWEKFHLPSKDFSPSVAGALTVWMTLGAAEREKIRKAVYTHNIDSAIKLTKKLLQ